jgi:hypothetical protein
MIIMKSPVLPSFVAAHTLLLKPTTVSECVDHVPRGVPMAFPHQKIVVVGPG